MRNILFLFLLTTITWSCQNYSTDQKTNTDPVGEENPPAPGFNEADSDAQAIALADTVMQKMGGRQNWDNTRYLHWNFFGRRTLLWDKWNGDVRIEVKDDSSVYLVNINDDTGRVFKEGAEIVQPDSLKKYIGRAKSIWINDSYWLVMPFKLKDSGLTLKYAGTATTQAGEEADVLQLTFENIGDTPQNKYLVYVDKLTGLICQWDFYTNAEDPEARFSTPWNDYKQHGNILLSGDRGRGQLTEIMVMDEVSENAFTDFKTVNLK